MTRSATFLASAALAVLLLAGPPVLSAQEPAAPAPVAAPMVSVVRATEQELVVQLVVTGSLAAREEVLVGPEIDGSRIVELLVEEGDLVERGQVLARLSRELWDAQLASIDAALERAKVSVLVASSQIDEAEAARAQAEADFQRAQALIRRGNTSAATLDERQAAARAAAARVAAAEQSVRLAEAEVAEAEAKRREIMVKIGMTEIKTPAAGRISERNAWLGALAAMNGEPLFRIVQDDEVELHAQVAEVMLASLAPGQEVLVTPAGWTTPIEGEVRLVAPKIDPQTRLGKVKIRLEDARGLTLGTFARARVEIDRQHGVTVPVTAIQFVDDHQEIQVVRDGMVETRQVTVGLRTSEAVIVTAGLEPGEQVVAVSGTFLRDGDRVRPVDGGSPAPVADSPQASAKS
ncbi:efflux RND transporter periplasmic adaptor subunit [Geminicoccus flavidas]|uniref:efflux RND transporter periplasmic adaptor subunit n=1 Tax=Geminicoccus flavidas TaxID=2506407 RepID=UPI00135CE6B0|nr:efflux RND transporter periplasmic adaptor subunit [Geminicoccus flavidas]